MIQDVEVMSTRQIADFLGVSSGWVYRHRGEIPHRQVGSRVLFHKPTVEQWFAKSQCDEVVEVPSKLSPAESDAIVKRVLKNATESAAL